MSITDRDRRALLLLALAAAVLLLYYFLSGGRTDSASQPSADRVPFAEAQLRKLRTIAATLPSKDELYKQSRADLDVREKSLIQANDEKLAQERLLDIVQKLALQQAPALDIRSKELGQPKAYGSYGEVTVTLMIGCRVEQLVNFLSDLTAQPEAIATEEVHVFGTNPETKEMQVRVMISGLIPGRLLPKKKETNEF